MGKRNKSNRKYVSQKDRVVDLLDESIARAGKYSVEARIKSRRR